MPAAPLESEEESQPEAVVPVAAVVLAVAAVVVRLPHLNVSVLLPDVSALLLPNVSVLLRL